jgi:hypothetical protein
VTLEWALAYARRYWMIGNEPESQRALTLLAQEVERLQEAAR